LDLILHGSPRIPSPGQCFVPGLQEHNSFGKEWKGFEQQMYEAHQYLVLLYYQSINKGNILLVWCPTGDMIGDRVLCFRDSETKSWEWFLHRIQDQENPK
jgi:hypothetical protein